MIKKLYNMYIIALLVFLFICNIKSYATGNYYSYPNTNNYLNPNYNYYPNFNQYYNGYYPNYIYDNYGYNAAQVIPDNSYYYIAGYDRNAIYYCNGLAMISRVPIIGGNNYYPTRVANGIICNAYGSISTWCNDNILSKDGVQDYFLNYATIVSETASSIVLDVNCSFKKGGVLNGHTSFRINVDISRNRYQWRRLREESSDYIDDNYEIYDYDSGKIIIIEE